MSGPKVTDLTFAAVPENSEPVLTYAPLLRRVGVGAVIEMGDVGVFWLARGARGHCAHQPRKA